MDHNAITGVQFEGRKYVFHRTNGTADPAGRLPGYIEKGKGTIIHGWFRIGGDGFYFVIH